MPAEQQAPESPSNHWPSLGPALKRLSVLAGTMALAFGVHTWDNRTSEDRANQALTAIGNLYDVQPQDITGDGLPTIPERHGPVVSTTEQHELQGATVAVLEGTVGDQRYSADETGTVVAYKGHKYVLTALHGFDSSYSFPFKTRAADELTGDKEAYAIASSKLTSRQRDDPNHILGTVAGVAFIEPGGDLDAPDVALLKIKAPRGYSDHAFKKLAAIPMASHVAPPPRPGEPVEFYGLARSIANPHPVASNGTYLGRVQLPAAKENLESVDVVGIKATNLAKSACEHGGSGEDFVAGNGYVSGPHFYAGRLPSVQVPFGEQTDQAGETATRWQIQKALHANLQAYTDLCVFTVVDPSYPKELVKGFGVQEDPYRR